MTQYTSEALLQRLEDKGLLRNRAQATAMLLCQENMPPSIRWGFWVAFSFWLILWVILAGMLVAFVQQDWAFYGLLVLQMLIATVLYCWSQKSYRFEAFLSATVVALGLSSLLFLLPIPMDPLIFMAINLSFGLLIALAMIHQCPTFRKQHPWVLSSFCLAVILISFLSSPLIIYSLILLSMGMDNRKLWISVCGMALLVLGLGDLAYVMPLSLKLISLIFIVCGLICISLPFFWHKPTRKVSTSPVKGN